MVSFDEQTKVLHEPFDFAIHNKTFINYCEVVILDDGTIEYSIPSHMEKLLNITANKFGMTRQELDARLREECEWYFEICSYNSKCMLVSNKECRFFFEPTAAQLKSLQQLVKHGCVDLEVFDTYYQNVADFDKRWRNVMFWQVKKKIESFFEK